MSDLIGLLIKKYPKQSYWSEMQDRWVTKSKQSPSWGMLSHWAECIDAVQFIDKVLARLKEQENYEHYTKENK